MTQRRLFAPALAAVTLLAAAGALYLAAAPDGRAADKSDPKSTVSALDFVPGDAAAVVSVRVADLWNHPAAKAIRENVGKELPDALASFRKALGAGPDEIERVSIIGLSPQGPNNEEVVAVTTLKPYNRKAVLAAAAPDAKEEKLKDHAIYNNPRGPSVYFLDDRTYLFAQPEALGAYLKHAGGKIEGALTPALTSADKHLVVMAADVAAIARTAPPGAFPPDAKPLLPLLKGQLATLTVDLDGELRADARLTFANEADAKDGAAAADVGLDQIRGAFAQGVKQFTKEVDVPKLAAILEDAQAALKAAKAERKETAVEVSASMKIDPEAVTAAATEDVPKVIKDASRRMMILNDLKQLVLAMHDYNNANGHLPPAAICDKNGKPLLSWRVAILPYIEQDALYKEFHLDEPWDSDHNKPLLEKMPTTFAPPDSEAFKKHETFYQVFVGKGSVFDGQTGLSLIQITDGTSNTLAIVDAAKSVPWTKPEDIPFDEGKLLPKVGGLSKGGGFFAAFCDGSVRTFPPTLKEETLRALVTPNGNEVIPDQDLDR